MGGERVVRISVTLPESLASELDKLAARSFKSRSRAVAEAVRMLVEAYRTRVEGPVIGIISYWFTGHRTAEQLRELGHRYADVIVSTLHVHIGEDECIETLVVRGDGARVTQLIDELARIRGVVSLHRFLAELTQER